MEKNLNLKDTNQGHLGVVAAALVLRNLAGIKNLTKLKMLSLGFTSKDIRALIARGFLVEQQDVATNSCYYSVDLSKIEDHLQ